MRRVLFICDRSAPLDLDISGLLPDEGSYDWSELGWNAVRADSVTNANADMIVAVTPPRMEDLADLSLGLADRRSDTLLFAILRQDIEAPELEHACSFLDDFVLWPASRQEIMQRIRRLAGVPKSVEESIGEKLLREIGFAQLVGEDPAFLKALGKISMMAESSMPVLIAGETGTGKEFSARAIHHLGGHRSYPFIPVDCGAIPEQVFENEMFGHVRGGYTDAHSDQKGLAELADGGTLFLDEVDSLSMISQSKLLRFLQERTFKPLGASKFVSVKVRIIAATNKDLEECVRKGLFRADLYYRLNVLKLALPALRERPLDIPLLSNHFLKTIETAPGAPRRQFSQAALRKLAVYEWPGNVRELHNVVQQAAFAATGPQILPEDIPLAVEVAEEPSIGAYRAAKQRVIASFERTYLAQLLRETGGNITRAAKHANRDRRSIGRLVKKYKLG